jgi:DTW domain-containing protein YfiP
MAHLVAFTAGVHHNMRYHASPLEPPRKLRISRGRRSQPRCAACALPPPDCICAELRLLTLETRVVVFLHRREVYKTTNTAQLVPLTLSHSSLHIVGLPEDRVHYRDLEDPTRTTLLLSPTDSSVPLTAELARGKPVTLIVPDGNWRQTRRMARNEPELAALPAVHLPEGPRRRFELRKHPEADRFSTFEAIARALGILEGAAVQEELERVLALKVAAVLRTRGLSAEQDA